MKRITLASLLLVAFLLSIGCADDRAPSGPTQPQGNGGTGPQMLPRSGSGGMQAIPLGAVPLSTTKAIKANSGGDVAVGLVKVTFPPHSIPHDVDVTITLADQERMLFRVEPVDLPLLLPVRIEIEHMERTDVSERRPLRVVRLVNEAPQLLAAQRDGGKTRAETGSLGEFGLAEMDGQGEAIRFVRYLSGPGYETKLIEAARGGEVHYDRYQVTIPKGALAEDTYITVRDPGSDYLVCELEPHGTVFLTPVELEMNLKGLEYQPYTDWTVYWFDEADGQWENQGGVFAGEKVTVQLAHFSTYAVARGGRAGW